jgi:tagaturonate reductase
MQPLNRKSAGVSTRRPIKVLQFGEGNFLRAFVDWIIETLNQKTTFNGDVQIIQPISKGMGQMINSQEGLYHVVLNGIRNGNASTETQLITCVRGVINPYESFENYLGAGENPDLLLVVSNTTEAGIEFNPNDDDPGTLPQSFPGKLTSLLFHRFKFFHGAIDKALTIIPCELIDRNGQKLKEAILKYIRLWNLPEDFRTWVQDHTTFCNTLVDRIVPGFPKETISDIQAGIGYEDKLVVMAEPFHLWVIEAPERVKKIFPAGKAGLDVLFVNDQTPYRTRKVRILNGAHTAMVPVAYLHGLRTVRDAIEDAFVGTFLKDAIDEEIIPTLDLPEDELRRFANDVIERFQNPFIKHELSSIALNSISKFKVRVLPSIIEFIKRKKSVPERLLFSLACLIQFYSGQWNGEALPVNDTPEVIDFFAQAWTQGDIDDAVRQILSNVALWDTDLTQIPGVLDNVTENLKAFQKESIHAVWMAQA